MINGNFMNESQKKEFHEFCENEGLKILKIYFEKSDLDTSNREIKNDKNDPNLWKSLIFVGTNNFRVALEVQFSTIDILGLAASKFRFVSEKQYIETVKDFMKEFCNILAGKIKGSIENTYKTHIGLPFITKKADLPFLFKLENKDIFHHSWTVGDGPTDIIITIHYTAIPDNLSFNTPSSIDQDEQSIDFF